MSEELSCSRCIHNKMCIARSSYDAVITTWNEQYPFVKMSQNGDILAESCSEYKTLTDIHMIKPTEKEEKKDRMYPP